MDDERSDLEDVIREEASRGRRPVDAEARKRRRELLRDVAKTIREGNEREFLRILRALGLQDGSPKFANALRIWRDVRRRQTQSSRKRATEPHAPQG